MPTLNRADELAAVALREAEGQLRSFVAKSAGQLQHDRAEIAEAYRATVDRITLHASRPAKGPLEMDRQRAAATAELGAADRQRDAMFAVAEANHRQRVEGERARLFPRPVAPVAAEASPAVAEPTPAEEPAPSLGAMLARIAEAVGLDAPPTTRAEIQKLYDELVLAGKE